MGTSAINKDDDDYEFKYHGNCDPSESFCQGAWMLPYDLQEPDPEVEQLIQFKCDDTAALLNGLEGCQLVDNFGKCYGYQLIDSIDGGAGNYIKNPPNGPSSVRLQWIECETGTPDTNADFDADLLA